MPTFEVVDEPEVARLVRFSTGQLNPHTKDEIDVKCFSDASNKRKMVVTTEVNSIEYSGQNFGQSNAFSTDNCDYYVAVQRKGANKIQIVPAELFCLNPKTEEAKATSVSDDEAEADDADEKRMKLIEKNRMLTAQFGSGTSQRILKRSLERKMDDGVLNLMSQSVPTTPKTSRGALKAYTPSTPGTPSTGDNSNVVESNVIPPHNKNAERPEDVYLQETIIPHYAMEPLREQSEVFIKCSPSDIAKWKQEKTYTTVVLSLLDDLPLSSEERQSKCCLIMYLHCLMFSYNLKAASLGRNHHPSEWKGLVKKLLDDNFTVCAEDTRGRRRRLRPGHLKDLLLSHILILCMRLKNYNISFKPLVEDLKLQSKRLALHATTLGFKVSGTVEKVAKLVIPFSLPPPSGNKKKSKSK